MAAIKGKTKWVRSPSPVGFNYPSSSVARRQGAPGPCNVQITGEWQAIHEDVVAYGRRQLNLRFQVRDTPPKAV